MLNKKDPLGAAHWYGPPGQPRSFRRGAEAGLGTGSKAAGFRERLKVIKILGNPVFQI